MIRLFDSIETDFTHNGIQVLDDVVYGDTCILTNEINGTYPLEMEVSIVDNEKWKDIDVEMLLRVPTSKGEQIFRIKEIVKGINSIKVYGKHVFYDLENNFILDTNIVQKDGRGAINQILGAMANNTLNTFYGTSDISIVNNSRLVRKNVVSALIGSDDNSFINRWGGELEVDNFNFSIKQRIGEDRDFQVRYRKNLTGFEGNTNTYNLCTRIVPIGFDGIMLEEKWVDSEYINNYPQIYTYEIKFDDIKVKENADDEEGYNTLAEAQTALRQAAKDYFITTKCDIPSFSATVNFQTLRYTEEYKDLEMLERVELGDYINVYIDKIDININARVVKTTYNFFTEKYKEISIGDVTPNLFKQIISLKNAIDLVTEQLGSNTWQDILDKALDEATKLMQEGLKDSYVITMKNQIVIGDNPNINNMINCIVINKNGIGFSNNGYLPDRLISAMTIDGKINASCITTGQLNAALIKTGLLSSANGSTWINMENGTFNLANKVKFDGNDFSIDLSGKDLATNTSVDSKVSTKVSKGTEFKTEFNQNAEEFNFSIGNNNVNVKITKDGLNIKNGAITITDNNGNIVMQGDSNGNLTFKGKLQPNDYQLKLFGNDCKIDGSANAIRLQLTPSIYIAVDNEGGFRLFNQNSSGGTRYTSINYSSDGHTMFYNDKTLLKLLGGNTPQIQARNTGDNAYVSVAGSEFINASSRKYKTDIEVANLDFIKILKENKVKKYKLKDEVERLNETLSLTNEEATDHASCKIGFILEELTGEARKFLNPNNSDGIDTYSMVSMLWGIVQEQQKMIEILNEKVGV